MGQVPEIKIDDDGDDDFSFFLSVFTTWIPQIVYCLLLSIFVFTF